MIRSRLFGFLAIALCFLASVCAHGAVSVTKAQHAVKALKQQTLNVVLKAQDKYRDAEGTKNTVESRKAKAENAASAAETAASGNTEAEEIAKKAKDAMQKYVHLYPEAKRKAQEAFEHTKRLLSEARTLDSNADIKVLPNAGADNDYSTVSERATALKTEAEGFEEKFRAATALINAAQSELRTISDHAEDAQVAKYKVDAIVKVVEMEAMLKKADADIESLGQKKDKLNTVVQEIRDIFGNVTREVYLANMGTLYNAEGDLRTISNRVQEVKEAKKEIVKQKGYADGTLEEIKEENKENAANKKLGNINSYAKNAEKSLEKIRKELEYADIESGNANSRKNSLVKRLAQKDNKPNGEEGKTSAEPQPPANKETTKPTKKGEEQTVTQNSEQTGKEGTETQASKTPVQTVANKPEQPGKEKTTSPVNKEVMSTTAESNDNAITVAFSLPLLLFFVAALH